MNIAIWSELVEMGTVRAPVFGRHQFFGTSEHYRKAHGNLLSGWMNYNYTACCWFPTSSNILILPSQFWQIRFESYWLHCSKCRILVRLRYITSSLHVFTFTMYFCLCLNYDNIPDSIHIILLFLYNFNQLILC